MNAALRRHPVRAPRISRHAPLKVLVPVNGLILLAVVVTLFTVQPKEQKLRSGEVAPSTIVAQRKVTFLDRAATTVKRQQVAQAVPGVYRYDPLQASRRSKQAQTFLDGVAYLYAGNVPAAGKLAVMTRKLPAGVSASDFQELPALTDSDFHAVQAASLDLLTQVAAWRYDSTQVTTTEISLLSTLGSHLPVQQRTAIGEVVSAFLAPTMYEDTAATAAKRRVAVRVVPPVHRTIYPGEVVVRRGDLITPELMQSLDALGLQSRGTAWQDFVGSILFAIVVITMLFWYLLSFHPEVAGNIRMVLLIDLSLIFAVAGARILSTGHVVLPLALPVAAAPTFAAVLIAPEACVAVALVMALLAGWVVANSFELTLYYLVTGTAGVLAIRHVRRLQQFILASVYISAFAMLTMLAFALVDRTYDAGAIQDYILAAIANGFLSSTLALGGFALLSQFFGVTTTLQLLELAQPNQPLLHRLMVRAPGTYNHALILSSMVERAAEEIGANSLIAKVGALYHDVGKTNNPHCFAENQLGGSNIHDELRPDESARIIRGHVSQGVRLARQHKVPRLILESILEHHGTMNISFFLHKARAELGDDVDESLYTYPGPRPQSKETALIMLADGCESAVRAAPDHTDATIRTIVDRIFRDRIESGQLSECPLTLKDLDAVKATYISVLNGLYHPRIEYPEPPEPTILRVEMGGRR